MEHDSPLIMYGKILHPGTEPNCNKMLTLGEEDDLLEDIKEGIRIAMHRQGYSSSSVDSIKINKLSHFVIQDKSVPITYGWYKYGPAPVFDTDTEEVEPTAKADIRAAEESRLLDPNRDFYSPNEYAYYFSRDCSHFDRILQTPTKQYLIEFYEDYAPSPYGALYEQNVQVQLILDRLIEGGDWHSEAEDCHRSVSRELTGLYKEILKIGGLKEVTGVFSEYSKTLKRIIAEASKKEELNPAQKQYVSKVAGFYYSHVWKYAALLISKNTVHLSPGNNDDKLLNEIDRELQNLRGGIGEEIQSLKEQGFARELYSEIQPEQDNRTSPEKEDTIQPNIEPWTKASMSSIREKLTTESDRSSREN